MRCDESIELLSQSEDESLPLVDRLALKSHLLFCKPCRRMAGQLRFLRTALSEAVTRAEQSGQRLSTEARARIERAWRQTPEP
jgi:hypothetical protein